MLQRRWSRVLAVGVLLSGAIVPLTAQAGNKTKGAAVFKAQKCAICHKVGGEGGTMGPELTKVGRTRNKAWLTKYLPNPKFENPKNKMPAVAVKGPDLDHLIAYLVSLK
jgi:putative heme-binding domain-containing protein